MGATETPGFRGIIVHRRQRRNRGEPLGPQPGHDGAIGPERHEYPRPRLPWRRRPQDRIRIQCHAGGRLTVATDIPAAAPEFLMPTGRVDRDRYAGFVAEAAKFHRVDGQPQRRGRSAYRCHRRRHPLRQRAGKPRQPSLRECRERAICRSGRQQQVRQNRRQRPAMTRHRRRILAIQRTRQTGPVRPAEASRV